MAKKKKAVAVEAMSSAEIASAMASLRSDMTALKKIYDDYSAQLLAALKSEGKKKQGIFTRSYRQTLKIMDNAKAFAWATDKNVFKIDTAKAMQIIRRELSVPEGFSIEQTEYISASGAKQED